MREVDGTYRGWGALKNVPHIYEQSFMNGTFNLLSKRERQILIMRFEEPRLSLTKVGIQLGHVPSTICEIENNALYKLQKIGNNYPFQEGDFLIGAPEKHSSPNIK